MEAKLNNMIAVVPGIKDSAQGKDIVLEVEKLKSKYLINAISILIQQIPDLQPELEGPLSEIGVKIPTRPPTGVERPGTGSSRHSNASVR